MEAIDRNEGLTRSVGILKRGGYLGLLVDQHAGDRGVWIPLFGRLASTSTLPAILVKRTGACVVAGGMGTAGPAKWRLECRFFNFDKSASIEQITAELRIEMWRPRSKGILRTGLAPQPMENPFPSVSVADLQTGSLRAQQGRAAIISNLDPIKRLVGRRGDVGGNSTPHQTRSTRRARYDSCAKKADSNSGKRSRKSMMSSRSKLVKTRGRWRKRLETCSKLRFSFRDAPRTGLEVWLARIPRRVGYRSPSRDYFLNQFIPETEAACANRPFVRRSICISRSISVRMSKKPCQKYRGFARGAPDGRSLSRGGLWAG